ncbi:hypothetical protein BH11PLA1_BH11PLA1_20200 [soil metagenome]
MRGFAQMFSVAVMVAAGMFAGATVRADPPCQTFAVVQEQGGPVGSTTMVFDEARNATLAMGTTSAGQPVRLFKWQNANAWTDIAEGYSGPMCYDNFRGVVVNVSSPPTVRQWDGQQWHIIGSAGPGPGSTITLAFDRLRGRTMMVYRPNSASSTAQLWAWTGQEWLQGPNMPVAASPYMQAAYDPLTDSLLVYMVPGPGQVEQYWQFKAGGNLGTGVWSRRLREANYTGPAGFTLATDWQRGRVYRAGGDLGFPGLTLFERNLLVNREGSAAWDFAATIYQADSGHLGRVGMGMAFDSSRGVLVVHGGLERRFVSGDGYFYDDKSDTIEYKFDSVGIAAQDTDHTVCAGGSSAFAMVLAGGPGNPTFSWTHDGAPATQPQLANLIAFNNATPADAGNYVLTVQDTCGTPIVSYPMRLTVVVPPAIIAQANTNNPCLGQPFVITEPIYSGTAGTVELQYLVAGGWVTQSTPLVAGAFNLGPATRGMSGAYRVAVTNSCGAAYSATLQVQFGVEFALPGTAPLLNLTPCATQAISVTAKGHGVLGYRWLRDGVALDPSDAHLTGVLASTLTIAGVRYEDSGAYSCRVTDDCGDVQTSAPVPLTLKNPVAVEVAMAARPLLNGSASNPWTMAYDEQRRVTVLYGGLQGNGNPTNSLYEYDGTTWRVRQNGFVQYDRTFNQPFFYNGAFPGSVNAAAYDPDTRKVYIVSEADGSQPLALYSWDGAQWTRPYYGPIMGVAQRLHMVYDRAQHRLVIIRPKLGAGGYVAEYLLFNTTAGVMTGPIAMSPPVQAGSSNANLVYDERIQRVVWYVNDGVGFAQSTMWVLNPGGWVQVAGQSPSYTGYVRFTYDPVIRRILTTGGPPYVQNGYEGYYTGEYVWGQTIPADGSLPSAAAWTEVVPDGNPHVPNNPAFAPTNDFTMRTTVFDRARRAQVQYGYVGGPNFTNTSHVWERRYLDAVMFEGAAMTAGAGVNMYSVSVPAAGYGTLQYQWQVRAGNSATWVNLGPAPTVLPCNGSAVAVMTGPGAATITLAPCAGVGSYFARCIVTNACGSVASAEAVLVGGGGTGGCQPADIANDAGDPLPATAEHPNNGINEGDYNLFFNSFFTNQALGSPADIADDQGTPLPPFGNGGMAPAVNNGVNEGDYNAFFNSFFNGCPN